jgi:hypothetical protein
VRGMRAFPDETNPRKVARLRVISLEEEDGDDDRVRQLVQ